MFEWRPMRALAMNVLEKVKAGDADTRRARTATSNRIEERDGASPLVIDDDCKNISYQSSIGFGPSLSSTDKRTKRNPVEQGDEVP